MVPKRERRRPGRPLNAAWLVACALALTLPQAPWAADAGKDSAELPSLASVRKVSYDAGSKVLTVEFVKYGTYAYEGVPQDISDALGRADSLDAYFNAHVRNHYASRKVAE